MPKKTKEEKIGYMCGVDWQHELEGYGGGTRVFKSIADLEHHMDCADECGIVEVKVVLNKWVKEQTL